MTLQLWINVEHRSELNSAVEPESTPCDALNYSCGQPDSHSSVESAPPKVAKSPTRQRGPLARNRDVTYRTWGAMKARCSNPNLNNFKSYGGRGIKVCDRWKSDYLNFLADMGPKPAGLSLERIDNDGNYEPSNCRWATRFDQYQNRRNQTLVTFDGVTMTLKAWSRAKGFSPAYFSIRVNKLGMTPLQAVMTPRLPQGRKDGGWRTYVGQ